MAPLSGCCLCLCLLALSRAAPMPKAAVLDGNVSEVQNQEEELQSLLRVADEQGSGPAVTVHEEHVQHRHQINGHAVEVDTARKTVSDTNTGEVLSDVKQEVSQPDDSAGAAPAEVEVKTEVDVPAEGIHETIVQSGEEVPDSQTFSEEEAEEAEKEAVEAEAEALQQARREETEDLEFNPEAVAAYLYRTGDYNRFYSALAQLVNASVMTEEDAQSYSQLVALEYDRLQMEEYENSILVQSLQPELLERYPLGPEVPEVPEMPEMPMGRQGGYGGYPLVARRGDWGYGPRDQPPPPMKASFDPYSLFSALWTQAYGAAGDAQAEAVVTNLLEKVRGDNDPDDESQVRDILLDVIASNVIDQEPVQAEQYAWQPMDEQDAMHMQPMMNENVMPMQPMMNENVMPMQPMMNENVMPMQPMGEEEDAMPMQPMMNEEEYMPMQKIEDIMSMQPMLNENAMPMQQPMGEEEAVMPMQPMGKENGMPMQPLVKEEYMPMQPLVKEEYMPMQKLEDVQSMQPFPMPPAPFNPQQPSSSMIDSALEAEDEEAANELLPAGVKRAAEVPTMTKRADEVPTMTKRADEVPTMTKRADEVPTMTKRADEVPTMTKRAAEVPTMTKRAAEVPTMTKRAAEVPTMTKRAAEVPTMTKRSAEGTGHEKKVAAAGTPQKA